MGDTVIPLHPLRETRTSLARVDTGAAELLSAGHAPTLLTAQIEVILADLRVQRDQLAVVLAELRGRGSEGRVDADATKAALALAIAQGIIQIDAFIARARASMAATDEAAPATPP